MFKKFTKLSTLFLAGLIAGTFFYGTFCVLPAFYDVSSLVHLEFRTALMQHNRLIVMCLVLAELAFNIVFYFQLPQNSVTRILCLAAFSCTLISLIITRFGSVPINLVIKTWDPAFPPKDWLTTLKKWDIYNAARTFTSFCSFIFLLLIGEKDRRKTVLIQA